MSRGVASRGCVVWASAVGVAPCGPSLVGVVWARPVLYCIVLGGPGTRGLALGAARALCCGAAYNMLCYVMLCCSLLCDGFQMYFIFTLGSGMIIRIYTPEGSLLPLKVGVYPYIEYRILNFHSI